MLCLPIARRLYFAQDTRLLLAVIAQEIVARRFSRAWVALAARQPIAVAPTAADAAL